VAGEALLALVVQADAAEHERLMLIQRRPQRGHRFRIQIKIRAGTGDLRADARGDLEESEPRAGRCRDRGHRTSFSPRGDQIACRQAPCARANCPGAHRA
jgi:hypothetical protein